VLSQIEGEEFFIHGVQFTSNALGCHLLVRCMVWVNVPPFARSTQKTILPIKYAMTTDDTVATIPGTMKLWFKT
jgi:hypothetical protein